MGSARQRDAATGERAVRREEALTRGAGLPAREGARARGAERARLCCGQRTVRGRPGRRRRARAGQCWGKSQLGRGAGASPGERKEWLGPRGLGWEKGKWAMGRFGLGLFSGWAGFSSWVEKLAWVLVFLVLSISIFLNQTKLIQFEFKSKFEFNTNTQTIKRDAPA